MTTTVYTITDETGRECSKCTATKKAMDRTGITYEVREMTEADREAFKKAGHMSAPVVVTDSDTWAGFRPDKILTLAGRES
ncbi:glutaredoxin domain-containing protein [Pseudarthrobacter sp. H3Y2-7]|uniref:glutaredoxin domain-containing protein n=1 Tax=Pseudarthrobacter naphthalenicus TaxID=3031328 RepID=UPI0023AEC92E|nr:glutaredoxin domain-containing protein [Pseudarthrobacter sp. H3Y2-7]MDE8671024.1 glutaredoxin domain-containing protein [Pseudarthrobacter sp. H3Y2-7]